VVNEPLILLYFLPAFCTISNTGEDIGAKAVTDRRFARQIFPSDQASRPVDMRRQFIALPKNTLWY